MIRMCIDLHVQHIDPRVQHIDHRVQHILIKLEYFRQIFEKNT
jgi:hypothetical protein